MLRQGQDDQLIASKTERIHNQPKHMPFKAKLHRCTLQIETEGMHTCAAEHRVVQSLAEGGHSSFHSAAVAVNHHINTPFNSARIHLIVITEYHLATLMNTSK